LGVEPVIDISKVNEERDRERQDGSGSTGKRRTRTRTRWRRSRVQLVEGGEGAIEAAGRRGGSSREKGARKRRDRSKGGERKRERERERERASPRAARAGGLGRVQPEGWPENYRDRERN